MKLPSPNEQPGRAVGERASDRNGPNRSYSRFRRRRAGDRTGLDEPTGLQQLEALAKKAVEVMEKYPFNPRSKANYILAMDLLRLQYNMNFMVVCEECGGVHTYDELTAPER